MATTLKSDARVVNNDDLLKRSVPAPKHDRDTSQAVADIVTAFDNIVGGSKQQADLLGDTSNNAAINNLVEILVPKAEPASATNHHHSHHHHLGSSEAARAAAEELGETHGAFAATGDEHRRCTKVFNTHFETLVNNKQEKNDF